MADYMVVLTATKKGKTHWRWSGLTKQLFRAICQSWYVRSQTLSCKHSVNSQIKQQLPIHSLSIWWWNNHPFGTKNLSPFLASFPRCKMFCTSGFHLSTWLSTLGGSCSSHLSISSYHATLGVSGYASHPGHGTLATWCGATWSFSRGICHGSTTGRCSGDLGKQLFEPERTHEWYLSHLETKEHQDVFFWEKTSFGSYRLNFWERDLNCVVCFVYHTVYLLFVCFWAFLKGVVQLRRLWKLQWPTKHRRWFPESHSFLTQLHHLNTWTSMLVETVFQKMRRNLDLCDCLLSTMVKSPFKPPFGEYLSFLFHLPQI